MQNPGYPACPFSYYTHTNILIRWVGVEGRGKLPSPYSTHPLNAKKITHYSAMPLLVRAAIFFSLCVVI